jgi:hypothetical protein
VDRACERSSYVAMEKALAIPLATAWGICQFS